MLTAYFAMQSLDTKLNVDLFIEPTAMFSISLQAKLLNKGLLLVVLYIPGGKGKE